MQITCMSNDFTSVSSFKKYLIESNIVDSLLVLIKDSMGFVKCNYNIKSLWLDSVYFEGQISMHT